MININSIDTILLSELSEERTDKQIVQKILYQIASDHNGKIFLMEQDEYLLNNVMQLSQNL